ncbi:MAG: tetratricopeptide repeat protein [Candidatus Heimdallarchaeota archaeon]
MPDSKSFELLNAEQLMYNGKFQKARKIIETLENNDVITSKDKISLLILKGRIYNYCEQYNEAIKIGEHAYQLSQELGEVSELIDALIIQAHIAFLRKLDKASDLILEAEKLFNSEVDKLSINFQRLQADLLLMKATIYLFKNEINTALEFALQWMEIRKETVNKLDISRVYCILSNIYFYKDQIEIALDYALKSLALNKELSNEIGIATSLSLIGAIYYGEGEFDQALKYCKQSLTINSISIRTKLDSTQILGTIYRERGQLNRALRYYKRTISLAEKVNCIDDIIYITLGIGATYRMKGDYDQSMEYFKRSYSLSKSLKSLFGIHGSLFYLILINLDKNSREQAQKYLSELEEIANKTENKIISQAFLIAKALVLKKSNRIRNRTEAEIYLNQVVEGDITIPQLHLLSLVNLCDLYIEELYLTNKVEILDDINPLISKVLEVAEKRHSFIWLAETKLLQAKLALIQMNFDEAKLILTQAQQIAELHGLNLLAIKISSEHDQLLEHLNVWDNLKSKNAPMSERIELASFKEVIDRLQGKSSFKESKLTPETPILLLIIGEGGLPVFSHSFTEELSFQNGIISGFLSAFNSFSNEIFSKGLDRAKFGDYILNIQSAGSFSLCYLFKGQTYIAKFKLSQFQKEIQSDSVIWAALNKFFQLGRMAELNSIPQLNSLIQKIFK